MSAPADPKKRTALASEWLQKVQLDHDLTKPQKCVAYWMQQHANKDFVAYPSVPTLAELGDMTGRTVSTALGKLVELGWLTVEKESNGRGNPTRYKLCFGARFECARTKSDVHRERRKRMKQTSHFPDRKSEANAPLSDPERVKLGTGKDEIGDRRRVKQSTPEPLYMNHCKKNPTEQPANAGRLTPGSGSNEALRKQLFDRATEVLGKRSDGLVSQLLKEKGDSLSEARIVIEQAANKENPRAYVAAILEGGDSIDRVRSLDEVLPPETLERRNRRLRGEL